MRHCIANTNDLIEELPQFVDPAQQTAIQYAILTLKLGGINSIAMGCYTGFAARVLTMLKDPGDVRGTNRAIGSCLWRPVARWRCSRGCETGVSSAGGRAG